MSRPTAKVFFSGRSQAVRIPKPFRFDTDEVYVERDGEKVILTPKQKSWTTYFADAKRFTDEFPETIDSPSAEERESF